MGLTAFSQVSSPRSFHCTSGFHHHIQLVIVAGPKAPSQGVPSPFLSFALPPARMSLQKTGVRCCARAARSITSSSRARVPAASGYLHSRRWHSTEAAEVPANPKIAGIVDQISQLTLLETADLVSTLKVRATLLPSTSNH